MERTDIKSLDYAQVQQALADMGRRPFGQHRSMSGYM